MIVDSENEMIFVGKNKTTVQKNHVSFNTSVLIALKNAGDDEITLDDLTSDEIEAYDNTEIERLVVMGFEISN
jgi:hypothetical protein